MAAGEGYYCNIILIIVLFICNHITIVAIIMERIHMILNIIEEKLKQKRDQERHNVMKLEWQKAELERQIAQAQKRGTNNENTQGIH